MPSPKELIRVPRTTNCANKVAFSGTFFSQIPSKKSISNITGNATTNIKINVYFEM